MPQMDYFRRPVLAGKNVNRNRFATIRGSRRRSDPDMVSGVPYFPGVVAGNTLQITVQGEAYTVILSSGAFSTILSEVNAVIDTGGVVGAQGVAFDSDGCLGLKSKTAGASSYVAVVGGTAADLTGFDLISNVSIYGNGGDVLASPEARVGNWQGTAFPRKGENFTIDSVNRMASRLAGNLDILHSEHIRWESHLSKLSDLPVSALAQSVWTTSPSSSRVFNGFGLLSRTSTPEELAPFFLLLDKNTKEIARNKVVAVTNGVPGVTPPPPGGYADTASMVAVDGGNFLGLDLVKVNAATIDEVRENRAVVCPGADFTTAGVVAGDLASIAGATNEYPWSHNGYRWVVEEVRNSTSLLLRPMSQSELAQMGVSISDSQPVLELNGEKATGEVYGTLTVRTGSFTTGTTLVFDPPIPPNAQYELWASQPANIRNLRPKDRTLASSLATRPFGSDFRALPNAPLSGFTPSFIAATATIGAGYLRVNDRVMRMPQTDFAAASFPGTGTGYIYWEEASSSLKTGTVLPAGSKSSENLSSTTSAGLMNHPIAKVTTSAGSITAIESLVRFEAEASRAVTVGDGGQFPTLEAAAEFLNLWATSKSETTEPNGAYSHFEIVLVSDVTTGATTITLTHPGIRIRGANPRTCLTIGAAGAGFTLNGCRSFLVEDLTVDRSLADGSLLYISGGIVDVELKNVKHGRTATRFDRVVSSGGSGSIGALSIEDSLFYISYAVGGGLYAASHRAWLKNSEFSFVFGAISTPQIMAGSGVGTQWGGKALSAHGCVFSNWATNSNAPASSAILSVSSAADVLFEGCLFTFGAMAEGLESVLVYQTSGNLRFTGNIVGSSSSPVPVAIKASSCGYVSENTFYVKPTDATASLVAVDCLVAEGNTVHSDVDSVAPNKIGTAVRAKVAAIGNYVDGSFGYGIKDLVGNTLATNIIGNHVRLYRVGLLYSPITAVIRAVSGSPNIVGNGIWVTTNSATLHYGVHCSSSSATVASNWASIDENGISFLQDTGDLCTYTANVADSYLVTADFQFETGSHVMTGNWALVGPVVANGTSNVFVTGGGFLGTVPLSKASGARLKVVGVLISTSSMSLTGIELSDSYVICPTVNVLEDSVVLGNHFESTSINVGCATGGKQTRFSDNKVGGVGACSVVAGSGVVMAQGNDILGTFSTIVGSDSLISGNFLRNTTLAGAGEFLSNRVAGTFALTTVGSPGGFGHLIFSNNKVEGAASCYVVADLLTMNGNVFDSTFSYVGSSSAAAVEISGNRFAGAVTESSLAQITFSNNYLSSASTLQRVSMSACTLNWGAGTTSITISEMSGCSFTSYGGGSFTVDDCRLGDSFINVVAFSTDNSELSNTVFQCSTTWTTGAGSYFLTMSGCTVSATVSTTFTSALNNATVTGCIFTSASGVTINASNFVATGNQFDGPVTVTLANGPVNKLAFVGNFFADGGTCFTSTWYNVCNATLTGNTFGGNVDTAPCMFSGNVLISNLSVKDWAGGSTNNFFRADTCEIVGTTTLYASAVFSNCLLNGLVNNQTTSPIPLIQFNTCRLVSNVNLKSELVTHLYISNCDIEGILELGATSGTGVQDGGITRLYFSNNRCGGAVVAVVIGFGSVTGCSFGSTAQFKGPGLMSGTFSIKGNEFLGESFFRQGVYQISDNIFNVNTYIGETDNGVRVTFSANEVINGTVVCIGITDSAISGNNIVKSSGSPFAGLTLQGALRVAVTGNNLQVTTDYGIYVNATSSPGRASSWINISNNVITQSNTSASAYCVLVLACNRIYVHDNMLRKAVSSGDATVIRFSGNCTFSACGNNISDGASGTNESVVVNDGPSAIHWTPEWYPLPGQDTNSINSGHRDGGVTLTYPTI